MGTIGNVNITLCVHASLWIMFSNQEIYYFSVISTTFETDASSKSTNFVPHSSPSDVSQTTAMTPNEVAEPFCLVMGKQYYKTATTMIASVYCCYCNLQSNNIYYFLLPVIVVRHVGSVSSSGVRYKPGSVLPRDAGSCLECQCGQNSQIACSPKDCITLNSLGDEDTSEPDFYGSNGEQNNGNFNMDMFAVNVVWWKSSGERETKRENCWY